MEESYIALPIIKNLGWVFVGQSDLICTLSYALSIVVSLLRCPWQDDNPPHRSGFTERGTVYLDYYSEG